MPRFVALAMAMWDTNIAYMSHSHSTRAQYHYFAHTTSKFESPLKQIVLQTRASKFTTSFHGQVPISVLSNVSLLSIMSYKAFILK